MKQGAKEGAEESIKPFDNPVSPIMKKQLRLREMKELVADPIPGRGRMGMNLHLTLSLSCLRTASSKTKRHWELGAWLLSLRNKVFLFHLPLTSSPELRSLENHRLLGPRCVPGTGRGFDVLDLI